MTVSLAPFVPSQPDVVRRMLEVAKIEKGDTVYDLGCGDGRILISAVKDFGAKKAVGYEMRKDLYQRVLEDVKKQSLTDRITVVNEDLFNANLSEATIITLYLTTSGNSKLKPKITDEAKVGTRVVSHDFDMLGWSYSKKENYSGHTIFLYTIPDCYKIKRDSSRFFSWRVRTRF
jgi:hypothetical protein